MIRMTNLTLLPTPFVLLRVGLPGRVCQASSELIQAGAAELLLPLLRCAQSWQPPAQGCAFGWAEEAPLEQRKGSAPVAL